MNIDIKKVIVLVREYGSDKVIIYTNNLPATVYPWDEPGSLLLDVVQGGGEQYVIDNFGVTPEVIKC